MIHLIFFPTETSAAIRSYPTVAMAEEAAVAVPFGSVYVFANLSERTLDLLSPQQLLAIYNTANPGANRVRTWPDKASAIGRVMPLIPKLAVPGEAPTPPPESDQEEEDMARKKKAAAEETPPEAPVKAKKGRKKAAAKATPKGEGKPRLDLSGKKLYKTEEGERIKRHPNSARTVTYNIVKDGMKWEKALELGADEAILRKLIQWDNIRVGD